MLRFREPGFAREFGYEHRQKGVHTDPNKWIHTMAYIDRTKGFLSDGNGAKGVDHDLTLTTKIDDLCGAVRITRMVHESRDISFLGRVDDVVRI